MTIPVPAIASVTSPMPPDQIYVAVEESARGVAAKLFGDASDPVLRAIMNAVPAGRPLPNEWREALRTADAEITRGQVVPDKEVRRALRDLDRDR
jgi:hypothetical protein